ncbi:uncharacterized protein B0I36DRAFT_245088 [Microdochium trichocladiopsis]|uniref:Swiss Army Knife RNA repair protein HAD domain-containing protein n=1 Tax=Microdochium trichocladiopsis TaxID=1682393 RepID=A0A9P9BPI1_9PEZI|nr:uncharacterized protein B0I36DRAFT_245088 [Microdochium trichocladiopsis]KAH7029125.1 hypothetical protein B0I36DRAFT_245088 [Microdochium trichocladiopsis]
MLLARSPSLRRFPVILWRAAAAMAHNSAQPNGSAHGAFTLTALSRWSVVNKQLPSADSISAIHIYDFDNTLFKTPLPNPKLWNGQTLGQLGNPDIFINGGWWHDSRILAATGEGADKEEPRGWDGWWNEKIVELVRLSIKQDDALTVLLTGRGEQGFADLIKRIVNSKGLEFDMVGLKPAVGPNDERFRNTMHFKQVFLQHVMETYKHARELRIYEDRQKHVTGFRSFFNDYNQKQRGQNGGTTTRGPISAEVVPVADISTTLDPVVEVAEVQHLVNGHNALVAQGQNGRKLSLKKTVFFTSYMINQADTKRLFSLISLPTGDLKLHANQILICPRPCPSDILAKVGGMDAKMTWQVTGTACYENSLWAVSVKPVPETAQYHTENPTPLVVIALRKGARPADAARIQSWQPVVPQDAFTFETTVGEKVMLRIEPVDDFERNAKRKFEAESENSSRGRFGHPGARGGHFTSSRGGGRGGPAGNFRGNNSRGQHNRGGARGGHTRGGRGGGAGGNGGGGKRNNHYQSLDDVGTKEAQNGPGGYGAVSYDDSFPVLGVQGGQKGRSKQQQQGGGGGWNGNASANNSTTGMGSLY